VGRVDWNAAVIWAIKRSFSYLNEPHAYLHDQKNRKSMQMNWMSELHGDSSQHGSTPQSRIRGVAGAMSAQPATRRSVDQVAFSYSSARGLPRKRPTFILTDTFTTIPLQSFIWGRPRNPICKEVENKACQRITARRYINISPLRLFHSTTRDETKQHYEDNEHSTCIIPQHISHTSASGHHGLRHNTTRPA
jgi:hypothetical protein